MQFPVFSLRSIPTPIEATDKAHFPNFKHFVILIKISDLPKDLNNWTFDQFRVQNPQNYGTSWMTNRGITILAEKLNFDNKTNIAKLELTDKQKHGVVDGAEFLNLQSDQIVRLEIITGVINKNNSTDILVYPSDLAKAKQVQINVLINKDQKPLKLKKLMKSANFTLEEDINCYDFLAKSPDLQKLIGLENTFVFKNLTVLKLNNQADKDYITSEYGSKYLNGDLVFFENATDSYKTLELFKDSDYSLLVLIDKIELLAQEEKEKKEQEVEVEQKQIAEIIKILELPNSVSDFVDNTGGSIMSRSRKIKTSEEYSIQIRKSLLGSPICSENYNCQFINYIDINKSDRDIFEEFMTHSFVNKRSMTNILICRDEESNNDALNKFFADEKDKNNLFYKFYIDKKYGGIGNLISQKQTEFWSSAKNKIEKKDSLGLLNSQQMQEQFGIEMPEKYDLFIETVKEFIAKGGVYTEVTNYPICLDIFGFLGRPREMKLKDDGDFELGFELDKEATGVYKLLLDHSETLDLDRKNSLNAYYLELKTTLEDLQNIDNLMPSLFGRTFDKKTETWVGDNKVFTTPEDFKDLLFNFRDTRLVKPYIEYLEYFDSENPSGIYVEVISKMNFLTDPSSKDYTTSLNPIKFLFAKYLKNKAFIDDDFANQLDQALEEYLFSDRTWLCNIISLSNCYSEKKLDYFDDSQDYNNCSLGNLENKITMPTIMTLERLRNHWNLTSNNFENTLQKYPNLIGMYQDFVCSELIFNGEIWLDYMPKNNIKAKSFGMLNKDNLWLNGNNYSLGHKQLVDLFGNYLQQSEVLSKFGEINDDFLKEIRLQKLQILNELSKNSDMRKYRLSNFGSTEIKLTSVANKKEFEDGKFEEEIAKLKAEIAQTNAKKRTQNRNISQPPFVYSAPITLSNLDSDFLEDECEARDRQKEEEQQKLDEEERSKGFYDDGDENDEGDYTVEWIDYENPQFNPDLQDELGFMYRFKKQDEIDSLKNGK